MGQIYQVVSELNMQKRKSCVDTGGLVLRKLTRSKTALMLFVGYT